MKEIISDLKILFKESEIKAEEFENFLAKLKSLEVTNYIEALSKGSQPEPALREVFFTNNSKFAKHLFKNVFPEVNQEGGFLDYLIKSQREEISLEIKPLYDGVFKIQNKKKIFSKIKKIKLNPEKHKKQILKYLKGTREFVVLTNLEDWYFYSKSYSLGKECEPFGKANLFELLADFQQVEDFWQYLDNKEDLFDKDPLDKKFFASLKFWVSELNKVTFLVNQNEKTELIINLINKFIFIQSLDKFWVIGKNYIAEEWANIERKWTAKNKKRILRKFLEDINEYFYELYDTELFKRIEENKTILDYIEQDELNIQLFYQKFKFLLGIDYAKTPQSWNPGIIQYNFRRINEDVLGKSYEAFLAEIRKEQGIYYTPKYITQYIIDNTVKRKFKLIIEEIAKSLEKKEYNECHQLVIDLFSIKILDPACGSGSFLIKALKSIWEEYNELNDLINSKYEELNDYRSGTVNSKNDFQEVLKLKKLLNFEDKRKLISSIIIRHIHGVDLDNNAIEVAKLNLWLEAIKLAPKEFRFNKVPEDTNHILPDLEMNLYNGDSLVGLPIDQCVEFLKNNHDDEIKLLFKLRDQYIEEPGKIELLKEINIIKSKLRNGLYVCFENYLKGNGIMLEVLTNTIPLFWPLEFWFVYFDHDSEPKARFEMGFTAIIGNPPYFTIRGKGTGTLMQSYIYNYLQNDLIWKKHFRSQTDIYYYFTIKSIDLLKNSGAFGFIIESYWIENDYADRLKENILNEASIEILIRFGRVKIFEDADNDTCILIFEKEKNDNQRIKYVSCKKNFQTGSQQQNNLKLVNHIIENIKSSDYSDEYIDIYLVNQDLLGNIKWVLSKSDKMEILKKIEFEKKALGDLCEIGQGMVPGRKNEFRIAFNKESKAAGGYSVDVGKNFIEVVNKRDNNTYRLESQFLKPLITNSGIKKYSLIDNNDFLIYTIPLQDGRFNIGDYHGISTYLNVFKDELESRYDFNGEKYPWYGFQRIQNTELFENARVKILCPYRAAENKFALDNIGYFGTTDMYAIVPKSDLTLDINYLLGILNSKVLTFWYKEAGKSKGLVLEFFANPLARMPICCVKDQNLISQLVSRVIILKRLNQKFKEIWFMYSQKYRTGTVTFEKLLINEKSQIQNGDFEKVWIMDVNLFPDSVNNLINKEFNHFKVVLQNNNKLKIYGIDDSNESILLELETKIQEFRDIIYLEVLQLLNSKRKVKKLSDIFSKSLISVIKPNIWEKSFNLIKLSKERCKNWISDEDIKTKLKDPIQLDDTVQNLENLIDAYVFKYYDLTIEDMSLVLGSLNTMESIKNDIIKKYENIILKPE